MKRIDYLLLAITNKLYQDKTWMISAFAITKEDENAYQKDPYLGRLVSRPWGYSFVNSSGELEKIDDATISEPLFTFKDRILVDSKWDRNITSPIETNLGNLFFNIICITSSFKKPYPFITGVVNIVTVENYIATYLHDNPKENEERTLDYFYVDEYLKFIDALQYISTFTQLCTWSVTRKGLLAPTGIKEFKATLLKKYEGKLTNPVEMANFEKELMDFDNKYLEGDPANNTFITGKIKLEARRKQFLSMGGESAFSKNLTVTPITTSLDDGISTQPDAFVAEMNSIRIGSYQRGAETVKGGVTAKYLLRAGNNFHIVDTDCGTKLGIHRRFTKSNAASLVGRYIIDSKLVHMENINDTSNYLDKEVIVRSPLYCKLTGDNICKICAGDNINKYPTGITIPLTEISGIILLSSLKAFHSNSTAVTKLKLKEAFT